MLRDAAEIGKVGANPVLPAGFESATALGSEVRPQLPLLVSQLGTKTPASIAQYQWGGRPCPPFSFGTHESRASEGALTKDPLLAPKKMAPFSPYQGKSIPAKLYKLQG